MIIKLWFGVVEPCTVIHCNKLRFSYSYKNIYINFIQSLEHFFS